MHAGMDPVFEYILLLFSEQGGKKTKGLKRLLPKPLRRFFQESLVLDLRSKHAVKLAVCSWITKQGELDATFRKCDVVSIKTYMSEPRDRPTPRSSQHFGGVMCLLVT